VPTNSTNSTILFELPNIGAYVTLVWGNSTNYGFYAYDRTTGLKIQNVLYSSGPWYASFLDYLKPSTTYYYKVTGNYSGETMGTLTGSWNTGSDSMNTLSGIVADVNETAPPSGMYVEASCTVTPSEWTDNNVYALSTSTGYYSMSLPSLTSFTGGGFSCTQEGGGYIVQVENSPVQYCVTGNCNLYSTVWGKHWNETIVVWDPQKVNFYLDTAYVSVIPVVTAMEFTHTGYASMSFCKGTSSSVETEADYSSSGSLFDFGYSATSSTAYTYAFGSQTCVDNQGEPGFEAWGNPHVVGDIMLNGVGNRTPWIPWEQYSPPLQNPTSGNSTTAPIQDWLSEPTAETSACYSTQYSAYIYHYEIPANSATQTFSFGISGNVVGVSGQQFSVSVPFFFDGVKIGSVSGQWGYTLTTSETNEFTVTVTIAGPLSAIHYYTIAGCTASGAAITLHVWLDSGPP
jgi:hypothetical protein